MKLGSRTLRQGSVATAITVVVVVVLVLLVMLLDALDSTFQLRADLTQNKAFQLSEATQEFLARLNRDVTMYVLTPEQNLTTGDIYYLQANEVLHRYAASPRIHLEYVDLARNPQLQAKFSQYQLNSQTILLESEGQTATVNLSDLFHIETDQLWGEQYIVSSKAEQVMTGALMGLTVENPVTAVLVEGFGEGGTEGLHTLLSANHYRVMEQNLLLEDIDPSADLVIISSPMRDYSEEALRKLDAFLDNGGQQGKTLLYFADVLQPETPLLDAFLADWGIEVKPGVIWETDTTKLVTNSNYWSIAQYTEALYAADALRSGLFTLMPEARPIRLLWEQQGNVEVTQPLIFTETARIHPIEETAKWSAQTAESGPFAALTVSTRTTSAGEEERYSHVVVAASSLMMEATVLQNPYMGNGEFLLGLLSRLTGQDLGITLAPKTLGLEYLPVSEFQMSLWGGVFTVLLPLLVMAAGVGIFLHRRHL